MNHRQAVCIAFGVLAVFVPSECVAQTHPVRWYRTTEGMPDHNVRHIVQDSTGFLWLGTETGVSRFDGYEFESPGMGDQPWPNTVAMRLCLDGTGRGIWSATDDHVFHVSQEGRMTLLHRLAGGRLVPIPDATGMALDDARALWIATRRGCFRLHPAEGWREVHDPAGKPLRAHRGVFRYGATGDMWIPLDGRRVLLVNPATLRTRVLSPFELVTRPGAVRDDDFFLAFASNPATGGMWVTSTAGLFTIDGPGLTLRFFPTRELAGYVYFQPSVTRTGDLWAAKRIPAHPGYCFERISHQDGGTRARISTPEFARMLPFGCVFEDRYGSVWIGGEGLGLVRTPGAIEYPLTWMGPLIPRNAMPVDARSMLISTWGGVFRFPADPFASPDTLTSRVGIVGHATSRVMRGADGALYWNQHAFGQVRYQGGTLTHMRRPWGRAEPGLPLPERTAILRDGSAAFVVSRGSNTLYRLSRNRVSRTHIPLEPEEWLHDAIIVATRRYGGVADDIVLVTNQAILRVRGDRIMRRLDEEAGLRGSWAFGEACEDSSGSIWFAATRPNEGIALYRMRNDTLTAFPHARIGMPVTGVLSVTVDPAGRSLLLSTMLGVYFLDLASERVTRAITMSSGLVSSACRGAAFWPDSVLWVLSTTGVTRIPMTHAMTDADVPRPVLTSLVLDDSIRVAVVGRREYACAFPPSRIRFSFTTFSARTPVLFTTLLEGYDSDWSQPSHDHQRSYTNLDPGEYRLRIRTVGDLSGSEPREAVFAITIPPPFHRTWWFAASVILTAGLIVLMVHAGMRRTRRRIERMRRKVAIDLHDEIGSTLTGISVVSSVIARQIEDEHAELARSLRQIGTSTRETIGLMGDIVWSLHPENDTLENFRQRLADMLQEQSELHSLEISLVFPESGNDRTLHQDIRRNLYLITREAVHNAVKHAGARSIHVEVWLDHGRVTLVIRDDGRGFDPGMQHRGTGMKSMRQRAQEIGARLEIESAPQRGTTVRVDRRLRRRA